MTKRTVLEWPYEPADFFDTPHQYSRSQYAIEARNGLATVELTTPQDPVEPSLSKRIEDKVHALFMARGLCVHRAYRLLNRCVCQYGPDGSKSATVSIEGVSAKCEVGQVDVIIRDAAGNVVRDTRAERNIALAKFIGLIADQAEKEPLLSALLRSYQAAVNDPANELLHLFEVREALAEHFGSKNEALKRLGISRVRWQRLGQLANTEPLEQSRHRGKHLSHRRSASDAELAEARSIALELIETFAIGTQK